MDRVQVLFGSRQQIKTHRYPACCADQMQAPTKELFLFSSTVATEGFASDLFATSCSYSFANGKRHTIHHKHRSLTTDFSQQIHDPIQPIAQLMQSSVETRYTQP